MRRSFILVPLGLASAAQADTTATYANAGGICSLTVKIASNGDLRGEMISNTEGTAPDRTYYFVGGKDYLVDRTESGNIVMRVDDMARVLAEEFAKMGIPSFKAPNVHLVRKGRVSVKSWVGDAYYIVDGNGRVSARTAVVISRDPSLAQLGKAMQRQFATSETLLSQITNGIAPKSNMVRVLGSGAPISFAGADLQSVSFNAIPKSEFTLPGEPVPIDQIRKRMIATPGHFSTTGTGPKPDVPCHFVFGR